MPNKPIPISAAQKIADTYGYDQVIIVGWDKIHGVQHVTTYGASVAECAQAAKGGNLVKRALGWPPEQCGARPAGRSTELQPSPLPLSSPSPSSPPWLRVDVTSISSIWVWTLSVLSVEPRHAAAPWIVVALRQSNGRRTAEARGRDAVVAVLYRVGLGIGQLRCQSFSGGQRTALARAWSTTTEDTAVGWRRSVEGHDTQGSGAIIVGGVEIFYSPTCTAWELADRSETALGIENPDADAADAADAIDTVNINGDS